MQSHAKSSNNSLSAKHGHLDHLCLLLEKLSIVVELRLFFPVKQSEAIAAVLILVKCCFSILPFLLPTCQIFITGTKLALTLNSLLILKYN